MELSIEQRATLTTTLGKFELVKDFLDKSIVEFNELLEEPKPSQRDKSKTYNQEAMEIVLLVLDLMTVLFKAERKGILR